MLQRENSISWTPHCWLKLHADSLFAPGAQLEPGGRLNSYGSTVQPLRADVSEGLSQEESVSQGTTFY